jgi:hypothetical protein
MVLDAGIESTLGMFSSRLFVCFRIKKISLINELMLQNYSCNRSSFAGIKVSAENKEGNGLKPETRRTSYLLLPVL